jgi:hypothetical protein
MELVRKGAPIPAVSSASIAHWAGACTLRSLSTRLPLLLGCSASRTWRSSTGLVDYQCSYALLPTQMSATFAGMLSFLNTWSNTGLVEYLRPYGPAHLSASATPAGIPSFLYI